MIKTHFPFKIPFTYFCKVAIKLRATYSDIMNKREKGRFICKQFAIWRQTIRQVVNLNQEQKRSQNRFLWNTWSDSFPRRVLTIYTTFCFQYFKKSFKRYNRFPDITLRLNVRISPLCQTLSKPFDMSKNTPLTSWLLSENWYILWVIERSWFMQMSLVRKPDWLDDNKSFSFKTLYSLLNKSLSKILLQIGSKETGL